MPSAGAVVEERTRRLPSASAPSSHSGGLRFDIQGLRAFAVLVVVLDHLTGWPGGGFVGVDVFFVISGFLITGLLLREHEKTEHISFTGFYRRRFKRIMPAAVLVLVATVVAARMTFGELRYEQTRTDAIWALFFSANWRYATENIDYFNADRTVSPVQHYWSLSIEEQFYFVWPWLMLGIFALLLRRHASRRQAHVVLGAIMATVVVASFAWAVLRTGEDAHVAYFSTFTRIWELGVGAFLAVAAMQLCRIPDRVRPALAWAGVAGLVASLWLISGDNGFPAPAAALPVLSTALVIAAGTYTDGRQQRWLWPLTNPAARYVGDASYSLYLWHFPIIVIGIALIGDSAWDKAILALVIIYFSYFSFELFEQKLRYATWSFNRRKRRRGRERRGGGLWRRSDQIRALVAITIATGVLVVAATQSTEPPESALAEAGIDINDAGEAPGLPKPIGPEAKALQGQILDALAATTWPNLDPTMDQAMASDQAPADVMPCGTGDVDVTACTFGPAEVSQTVAIVGDSIAVGYVEAIRTALAGRGWNVVALGSFGCPFVDAHTQNSVKEVQDACPDRNDQVVAAVNEVRPDVLLVANGYSQRIEVGETAPISADRWIEVSTDQMQKVAAAVGKVAYLASPPFELDPNECYTRQSTPADCTNDLGGDWQIRADAEQQLAAQTGATWVDSSPWFCAGGLCPAFVESTPVRVDEYHMTNEYAALIAPAVLEAFEHAKVLS